MQSGHFLYTIEHNLAIIPFTLLVLDHVYVCLYVYLLICLCLPQNVPKVQPHPIIQNVDEL